MKIPLSWVREFVDLDVPPSRLARDLTTAGLAVDGIETKGEETILDLDITTNRVDCMNVYGVARELSVLYTRPLKPIETSFASSGEPVSATVTVEAKDLCPRFCARVFDVKLGPSPAWIRERLEMVGIRSISNVVDLTNYVMIEMGQPSHAFDLDLVPDGALHVRWAKAGETLKTLDGVERTLTSRVGVVSGPRGALGLAGIMGGASSEVSAATRRVILEAAYWDPTLVRRAARSLSMHTEASHRFERGADPEGPTLATARAAHLLEKIGAGNARGGFIDSRIEAPPPRRARFRPPRAEAVLGADLPAGEWRRILEGLGFSIGLEAAGAFDVRIPTWRSDVSREIDLVEEVGRHHGVDKIPSTIPKTALLGGLKPWQARERALGDLLASAGFAEAIQYAFVSEREARDAGGERVVLENPLSEEQGALRNSLVVPGLLEALRANERQGRDEVALYEIGRIFEPAPGAPSEERRAGILWAGSVRSPHWSERPRGADFFDMKGVVDAALARLGARDVEWTREGAPSFLHPGQSAIVKNAGRHLGWAGRLHPDVARAFELRQSPVVAELRIEELLRDTPPPVRFSGLDRFPAVPRDVSLVCDRKLSVAEIEALVAEGTGPLLRSMTIVDRYDGPQVPKGKVSLTLGLVFQHPERTLTGNEVQQAVDHLVELLGARGAEIRRE